MMDAGDSARKLPDPDARSTRNDVEHLFGQCLLRFQAYEDTLVAKQCFAKAVNFPQSIVNAGFPEIHYQFQTLPKAATALWKM